MFALIRHAAYSIGGGSLSTEGMNDARSLAKQLASSSDAWKEIRTSPISRAHETAAILGQEMRVSVESDERLNMDGNIVDLLPPTEPNGIIFVSHLPVLTHMLRAWSKSFNQEEPPLTLEACGYLIDPEKKTILPIHP
jgi:phosphohistidine phosphatase SixA